MKLFEVDSDVRKRALQLFDRTEESFDDDVQAIKKWLHTQKHLPEIMEDAKVRNFLLLNKCSVENSKQKIDMYYTIRSLLPDWYENCNPKLPFIKDYMNVSYTVVHPKLVEDMYRVTFIAVKKPHVTSPLTTALLFFNIYEMRLSEDCLIGDIIIFDMKNTAIDDFVKMTPLHLKKTVAVYKNIFSLRAKRIIFLNSIRYLDNILALLKLLIKPKIFQRIEVHQDSEVLKEIFQPDQLPKDYGGNGPSLEELNDGLREKFDEYQNRFDQLDRLRVDESLRPEKLNNDEVLGFHGNFKKLNVD
ncbi:hypothetical protein MTP99_017903 [Tenebrio molitor]|nr:hypothetical protein MTP99_017903 [Tenebrio molitor]